MAGDEVVEFVLRARDDASRVISGLESRLGSLGSMFGGKSLAVAGIAGLATAAVGATAALTAMGVKFHEVIEQMEQVERATGVSIEKFQVWKEVIVDADGNADGLGKALQNLNRAIATNDPILKQIGITTTDTTLAFEQFVRILANSEDTAKKTEVAYRILGRGANDLLPHIDAIAKRSGDMEKAMRRSGALITEEMTPGAEKLHKQLNDLRRAWNGLWNDMQKVAVPVALVVVTAFKTIAEWAHRAAVEIQGQTNVLNELAKVKRERGMLEPRRFAEDTESSLLLKRGENDFFLTPVGFFGEASVSAKRKKDPVAGLDLDGAKEKLKQYKVIDMEAVEANVKLAHTVDDVMDAYKLFDGIMEQANEEMEALIASQLGLGGSLTAAEASAMRMNIVMLTWQDAIHDMLSSANILNESLGALWNGLQVGFAEVFAKITDKAQTFRGALKTIFDALVQEVLAMLAKLAATAVFGFLLDLLIPSFGGGVVPISNSRTGGHILPEAPKRAGGATNITVMAHDQQSILDSLTSPRGSFRRAFEQAAAVRI